MSLRNARICFSLQYVSLLDVLIKYLIDGMSLLEDTEENRWVSIQTDYSPRIILLSQNSFYLFDQLSHVPYTKQEGSWLLESKKWKQN